MKCKYIYDETINKIVFCLNSVYLIKKIKRVFLWIIVIFLFFILILSTPDLFYFYYVCQQMALVGQIVSQVVSQQMNHWSERGDDFTLPSVIISASKWWKSCFAQLCDFSEKLLGNSWVSSQDVKTSGSCVINSYVLAPLNVSYS